MPVDSQPNDNSLRTGRAQPAVELPASTEPMAGAVIAASSQQAEVPATSAVRTEVREQSATAVARLARQAYQARPVLSDASANGDAATSKSAGVSGNATASAKLAPTVPSGQSTTPVMARPEQVEPAVARTDQAIVQPQSDLVERAQRTQASSFMRRREILQQLDSADRAPLVVARAGQAIPQPQPESAQQAQPLTPSITAMNTVASMVMESDQSVPPRDDTQAVDRAQEVSAPERKLTQLDSLPQSQSQKPVGHVDVRMTTLLPAALGLAQAQSAAGETERGTAKVVRGREDRSRALRQADAGEVASVRDPQAAAMAAMNPADKDAVVATVSAAEGAPRSADGLPTFDELLDRIQVAVRRGESEWRLQLRPPNLGHLEVHLASGSNGIALFMRAETPEAQSLIQASLDQLRSGLDQRGVHLERCDVVLNQVSANGTGLAGDANSWHGPAWRLPVPSDPVPSLAPRQLPEPGVSERRTSGRSRSLVDLEA
jgi:flagellar hook-length control protein FliK